MTRDAALLERVGLALYGENWRGPLAKALGSSSDRALRRWMAGEQPVPLGVWEDLGALCAKRRDSLDEFMHDCFNAVDGKFPEWNHNP